MKPLYPSRTSKPDPGVSQIYSFSRAKPHEQIYSFRRAKPHEQKLQPEYFPILTARLSVAPNRRSALATPQALEQTTFDLPIPCQYPPFPTLMHIAIMAVAASQMLYQLANCRGRLPVTLSTHLGAFGLSVSVALL